MMGWALLFHKNAKKWLNNNAKARKLVLSRLKKLLFYLQQGTKPADLDIRKLKGKWDGFFRLRVGHVRVVFFINWDSKKVLVYWIGTRETAYK